MRLSRRIVLSMLSVVAIAGGVSTLVGGHLLWRHLDKEARNRVRQDLNAAAEFYSQRLETMAAALRYTALGERFTEAVSAGEAAYLAPRLAAVRRDAAADVLYVTDAAGRVTLRAHRPDAAGDSVAADRLVAEVLKGADTATGTILVPLEELRTESPALAERAGIRILATPKAAPDASAALDSGMMLSAAAAVRDPAGRLVGVLRAGVLLSRNFELVDQVQNTVFRGERYGGKPLGNATVFQGDVRISTNVLAADGSRAIGTRVSAEVRDRVLGHQKPWLGKAWVVNDWYVSAYAPIHDPDGRAIGMLYVGVLQRKFRRAALGALAAFAAVTLLGLAAGGVVAWKLAGSISSPVRALARRSEAIGRGQFAGAPPAPQGPADDEIAALARTFQAMAESLRQRDELLQQRTRMQLTRSERLASVGRLAAGVAHEINNPLTGVLTFAHLLLDDAPAGSRRREDLETIIEATTRCRDIVRGLLNFSRQNQPQKRMASLGKVLQETLSLTRNQAHLKGIEVVEEIDADLPDLLIDPNQIQEVAVNAILNAIDATGEGGTLTVRTRSAEADGRRCAVFEISDSGCGIAPGDLEHVFDPFFTTKPPGQGTGLGLAISYGIVTEHGGEIGMTSQLGRGTTVTVRLPAAREPEHEDRPADTGDR